MWPEGLGRAGDNRDTPEGERAGDAAQAPKAFELEKFWQGERSDECGVSAGTG